MYYSNQYENYDYPQRGSYQNYRGSGRGNNGPHYQSYGEQPNQIYKSYSRDSNSKDSQGTDELYKLKITQNREPMPQLHSYSDFAKPEFFQGPKFNFLKEASFGNASKHVRKQHEAEAQQAFDFVQESFLEDKDVICEDGTARLVLQKFESVEYDDGSPKLIQQHRVPQNKSQTNLRKDGKQIQPHEAIFDLAKERNTGNQFWK